jgi:hypothetical protein
MAHVRQYEHTYVQTSKGMRCKYCGLTKPMPVLHIRCEWCKELFDWHPRLCYLAKKGVKRTCSQTCLAKLRNWERDHAKSKHEEKEQKWES